MYKYVKDFGCVINDNEPRPRPDSPRLHTQHASIQYTIDAINMCGGIRSVAEALGMSTQCVRYWCTLSEYGVSAPYAVELSNLTGGKITPQQLLPHVFKD